VRQAARYARSVYPLALTANAWRPLSFGQPLGGWAFALGWHVSELPLATLAAELALTARALRGGRWRTGPGLARLAAQAGSAAGLVALQAAAAASKEVLEEALVEGLGRGYPEEVSRAGLSPDEGPEIHPWRAVPAWISRRSRLRAEGIAYGPAGRRNRLDVWAAEGVRPGDRAPVLVQVPGGAWATGDSRHQAYPLMDRLRSAGWVCVPISYRLSPRATWPDHLVDVKRAIAWVKDNIDRFGGDPDFVVVTGGSAGGHLTAMAALTAGEPEFQPGFEDADTSVRAAVPFYGVYDLLDWNGRGGPAGSVRYMERVVLKSSPRADTERWRRASPVSWVRPDAPPMMILHGSNDSLVPAWGARRFASELRSRSRQAVVYAELPRAQHAFDIYPSLRTLYTVRAVEHFLAWVRARRAAATPTPG